MNSARMIADIKSTIATLESEKTSLLHQVNVLEDRMAFYRLAIESLENAEPAQETPSAKAPAAPEKTRKVPLRGDTQFIEFNGETHTISEWAAKIGIVPRSLRDRLKAGWSVEKALTTPPTAQSNPPVMLEYNGMTKTVSEWAKQFNMTASTLHGRLRKGMSVEEALLTPLDSRGRHRSGTKTQSTIRGKVFMYDTHGNVIRQFTGVKDAARDLHISPDVVEKTIRNVSIKDQLASRNYYLAIAS